MLASFRKANQYVISSALENTCVASVICGNELCLCNNTLLMDVLLSRVPIPFCDFGNHFIAISSTLLLLLQFLFGVVLT